MKQKELGKIELGILVKIQMVDHEKGMFKIIILDEAYDKIVSTRKTSLIGKFMGAKENLRNWIKTS